MSLNGKCLVHLTNYSVLLRWYLCLLRERTYVLLKRKSTLKVVLDFASLIYLYLFVDALYGNRCSMFKVFFIMTSYLQINNLSLTSPKQLFLFPGLIKHVPDCLQNEATAIYCQSASQSSHVSVISI